MTKPDTGAIKPPCTTACAQRPNTYHSALLLLAARSPQAANLSSENYQAHLIILKHFFSALSVYTLPSGQAHARFTNYDVHVTSILSAH